jgi:hypothetical protein
MGDKKHRPIKDIIFENLHGEKKETALKFVEYLNANQMELKQWWEEGMYRIPFGDSYLCSLGIDTDYWDMRFFMGDYEGEFDDQFINSIHSHVKTCASCHGNNTEICPKGKDMTIFGKEFKNACIQFTIYFENPTEKDLEHIKKLIEYYKNVASKSECWHVQKKFDKEW